MYDDESAWHNKFYKEVTSKVDEDIFKPLYTTEREDNRVGCPPERAPLLVPAMESKLTLFPKTAVYSSNLSAHLPPA